MFIEVIMSNIYSLLCFIEARTASNLSLYNIELRIIIILIYKIYRGKDEKYLQFIEARMSRFTVYNICRFLNESIFSS